MLLMAHHSNHPVRCLAIAKLFYYRATLFQRGLCSHASVSVRLSVTSRHNCTNRAGFCLSLVSTVPRFLAQHTILIFRFFTVIKIRIAYLYKVRCILLELCPKLWAQKIQARQVDHVVNRTRRRSSLLTTLTTDAALCLDANAVQQAYASAESLIVVF